MNTHVYGACGSQSTAYRGWFFDLLEAGGWLLRVTKFNGKYLPASPLASPEAGVLYCYLCYHEIQPICHATATVSSGR